MQRGERGLFGLKRLFKTYDTNGNGSLEYKEFKAAITSFKLDVEDQDIQAIFKAFDENNDGTLDVNEFMALVLGDLNSRRRGIVESAYIKLDHRKTGQVPLQKVKEDFDGNKHPDVCNNRKTSEEAITDFLEIYDIHHNTFNNYGKNDKVTKAEFMEFYRTLSPSYEDDLQFIQMVKGVWNIKEDT